MRAKTRILLASRSGDSLRAVQGALAEARDLVVETRVLDAAQPDALEGVTQMPDLLVLRVEAGSGAELDLLAERPASARPPLLVIGAADDAQAMRAAMRAGARDFLPEPVAPGELLAAVARVAAERRGQRENGQGDMIAFVNAKGGSGATFLASNVAYLFAGCSNFKTALIDLDLQFGALPQYLDLQPQRSLLDALEVADHLDEVAIHGYLARHETGVEVLAGLRDCAMLQQEAMADRFATLLDCISASFDRVVVDLPRQVEPFGALVLERARRILLVMQQSVPSLHDATRMYDILTRHLGIPAEHISVVVNRYQKNLSVELADIVQALHAEEPICVPNDFGAATESINMGVPMYQHARRSPVTKALMQLERKLGGKSADAPRGLLPRLLRSA